jgi:hypothetical protein
MTRASLTRRERRLRRGRGRPKHRTIDPAARFKLSLATALQDAWHISERKAFDLVVALSEAEPVDSTGYRLPLATFTGRTSTLRKRQRKRGPLPPDDQIIAALMALALRCKDLPAALRLFRTLLDLAQQAGVEVAQEAITRLLAR